MKIIEWNINQRLNYSKKDMPEWIADVIKQRQADIVILTEFFQGNNWGEIKKKSFGDAYYFLTSNNFQGGNNDVAIAIKKENLEVIYSKSFLSVNHNVADHLEVKCKTKDNKEFLVVGMRIHASASHDEKLEEMMLVMDSVRDEKVVIIGGDFNNNRRGFNAPEGWHLEKLDEILSDKFKRYTPRGSSIFSENPFNSNSDYEFASDHFLIKGIDDDKIFLKDYNRDFTEKDKQVYKWGRDFNIYLGKDEKGKNKYDSVNPPYPDHAILIAEVKI
ncbi:endonuclease/exonuclease/phosphatase family protein [Psychrobacillus sp. FSL H8-0487]|uniref:endonuclease/exonuclease/phosphatase family protein n=1 Tax=Psychrobacillus sp. FSL H8-0487 TaxID=2921391 RepID=UPI0030F4C4CD